MYPPPEATPLPLLLLSAFVGSEVSEGTVQSSCVADDQCPSCPKTMVPFSLSRAGLNAQVPDCPANRRLLSGQWRFSLCAFLLCLCCHPFCAPAWAAAGSILLPTLTYMVWRAIPTVYHSCWVYVLLCLFASVPPLHYMFLECRTQAPSRSPGIYHTKTIQEMMVSSLWFRIWFYPSAKIEGNFVLSLRLCALEPGSGFESCLSH